MGNVGPVVVPTPTPAPVVIHPSFWARAATWVKHEASVVKNAILGIQAAVPAITAELQKVAPTVEALSEMIMPGSAGFEAHLVDVWSTVASAVDAAGNAATANGINVQLDQALVDAIKTFIPTVKAQMTATTAGVAPGPTPPKS
jgi:hypothetical protein